MIALTSGTLQLVFFLHVLVGEIVRCLLWWDIKLGFINDFTLKVLHTLSDFCIKLFWSFTSHLVNDNFYAVYF